MRSGGAKIRYGTVVREGRGDWAKRVREEQRERPGKGFAALSTPVFPLGIDT